MHAAACCKGVFKAVQRCTYVTWSVRARLLSSGAKIDSPLQDIRAIQCLQVEQGTTVCQVARAMQQSFRCSLVVSKQAVQRASRRSLAVCSSAMAHQPVTSPVRPSTATLKQLSGRFEYNTLLRAVLFPACTCMLPQQTGCSAAARSRVLKVAGSHPQCRCAGASNLAASLPCMDAAARRPLSCLRT